MSTCWSIVQLLLDVCVHLKAKQHQSKGWKGRPSPSPSVKMKRYQYSKKDDYDGKKIADLQIIWVSLKQERSQQLKTSDLLPQSQQQRNWSYDCFSLRYKQIIKIVFIEAAYPVSQTQLTTSWSVKQQGDLPINERKLQNLLWGVKSHVNVYTHNT